MGKFSDRNRGKGVHAEPARPKKPDPLTDEQPAPDPGKSIRVEPRDIAYQVMAQGAKEIQAGNPVNQESLLAAIPRDVGIADMHRLLEPEAPSAQSSPAPAPAPMEEIGNSVLMELEPTPASGLQPQDAPRATPDPLPQFDRKGLAAMDIVELVILGKSVKEQCNLTRPDEFFNGNLRPLGAMLEAKGLLDSLFVGAVGGPEKPAAVAKPGAKIPPPLPRKASERPPKSTHTPENPGARASEAEAFEATIASSPQVAPQQGKTAADGPRAKAAPQAQEPVDLATNLANFIKGLKGSNMSEERLLAMAEQRLNFEYSKLKAQLAGRQNVLDDLERWIGPSSTKKNRDDIRVFYEAKKKEGAKPDQHLLDLFELKDLIDLYQDVLRQHKEIAQIPAVPRPSAPPPTLRPPAPAARPAQAPPANAAQATPEKRTPTPASLKVPIDGPKAVIEEAPTSIPSRPQPPKAGLLKRMLLSPFVWGLTGTGLFTGAAIYNDRFKDLASFFSGFPKLTQAWSALNIPWTNIHLPRLDTPVGAMTAYLGVVAAGLLLTTAYKLAKVHRYAKNIEKRGYDSGNYQKMHDYAVENLYEVIRDIRPGDKTTQIRLALTQDLRLFYYLDKFRKDDQAFGDVMQAVRAPDYVIRNIHIIMDDAECGVMKMILGEYVKTRNPEHRLGILRGLYEGTKDQPHAPLKPGTKMTEVEELAWIKREFFRKKIDEVFMKNIAGDYVYSSKKTTLCSTLIDGDIKAGQRIVEELEMDYLILTKS